ncbi:MAG: SpoIIIAC/SpoIIIAD family protein [Lachnospiraceae bacterium]
MITIRVAVIGIVGVIFAHYFKNVKSEYGALLGLFVSMLIFYYIINKLWDFLDVIAKAEQFFPGYYGLFGILLKMLGISYVCELSSGICKDAGYQSVATQIVIFGKISIMIVGSSILFSLMELIESYLRVS